MKYLLDTHTFIWSMENSSLLKPETKKIVEDASKTVFISMVTPWEITIKVMLKKLQLNIPITKLFNNLEFEILPIKLDHVLSLLKLAPIHKDPFDRMLVAQSKSEKLKILTSDPKITAYFK